MTKTELYATLIAHFIIYLIVLPFAVAFFLCYAIGFVSEIAITAFTSFVTSTKALLAQLYTLRQNTKA